MKKLSYYLRWSRLRDFSTSWKAKAAIVVLLLPVLAPLARLLKLTKASSTLLRVKVTVIGAILFFALYFTIRIFIPEQIKEHSDSNSFSGYAKHGITNIANYFKGLSNLLRDCGHYCPNVDKQRLQRLLPPSEAVKRLGKERAALELSTAYYQLLDCSKPRLRIFCGLLLFLSWLLMGISLLENIIIILWS